MMEPEDAYARPLVNRARIRAAHEARVAEWPRERKALTIRAAIHVVEDHRKVARIGPFTIESDEGAIVGGKGTAPTPLSYFVASIGFAVLTDLVRAFAVRDLPVDDLRLEIEADFPLGAKYADEPAGVAASTIRYTVDVRSPAPRPAVEDAIAWAERFCHAVHSLREPVRVEGHYRLAGEVVAATG